MQLPKLLWLKRHNTSCWVSARRFFDLPDWLTYRATGGTSDSRSLCSTVCKWNYWVPLTGEPVGWNEEFFLAAGLPDLVEDNWARVG
jgi:ribulose kinase